MNHLNYCHSFITLKTRRTISAYQNKGQFCNNRKMYLIYFDLLNLLSQIHNGYTAKFGSSPNLTITNRRRFLLVFCSIPVDKR